MKYITVSTGIPERMKAATLMAAMQSGTPAEWHVVVHTDTQRNRILRAGVTGLARKRTHVSNAIPAIPQAGAAVQREWAERNLTAPGEWYATVDDNVQRVMGLDQKLWPAGGAYAFHKTKEDRDKYRKAFERVLSGRQAFTATAELMAKCAALKTVCGGFFTGTSLLYRRNHWQLVGCANTRWSVQKNMGRAWQPWPRCMWEDYVRSVYVAAEYGACVVDRWTSTHKVEYEPGGIGTFQSRAPALVDDCRELMARFPGLLRKVRGREYFPVFRKHTPEAIAKWRAEYEPQL